MKRISFIGLGNMGYPMAGHLVKNNYNVTVYNRSSSKAIKWSEEYKSHYTDSLNELLTNTDILVLCVGNDNDIKEIIEKATNSLKNGSIIIDHTTSSANIARECYHLLKTKNISFIDAPVSGGQVGAQNGQLTIMVGGDEDSYKEVEPLLYSYAKKVTYMGESGNGQLTKMVNQICLVGVIQGLAEGINFAIKSKLDPKKVIEVISQGAAGSWQMDNRSLTMIEDKFDFGFAINLVRKDLDIVLAEAIKNSAELPVTSLINQFYQKLVEHDMGKYDTSALIKLLNSNLS